MAGNELITFKFEGGLADKHQMNYYDAARFHYGAARLLLKLQHYKHTGRVLSRVSVSVDADFRMEAPVAGSLVHTIWDFTKDIAEKPYIKAPLSTVVGWVTKKLTANTDPLDYMEKIKGHEARQEAERTEQLRIVAELAKQAMVSKEDFLKHLKNENKQLKKKLGANSGVYLLSRDYERQVEAEVAAGEAAIEFKEDFRRFEADSPRIIAANRSAIEDMARPVDGVSAESLTFRDGNDHAVGYVNEKTVTSFQGETVDRMPTLLVGKVKSFDFETGWGKFRNEYFANPVSFNLPSFKRNDEMPRIVEAAKKGEGQFAFYLVRKNDGTVSRMILERVVDY